MLKEGHAGLSLILFSPFLLLLRVFNVDLSYALVTCLLMVGLSSVPDLDINFEIKHRGITHTFVFGIVVGVVFAIILGFSFGTLIGWLMGFFAGFGGTASHLLGDALTFMPFKPFYPFSDKEVAFGFCRASNKDVNKALVTVGAITIVIPFLL